MNKSADGATSVTGLPPKRGAPETSTLSKSESDPRLAELSDIQTLRARARRHVEDGAVTPGYAGNRDVILRLLNEALATELVCVLRYRRHYFMADGILGESVRREFLIHSNEELGHADELAARIVQLDGNPNFDPDGLARRSHAEYVACATLHEMVLENLVAERVAIESYREMISYVGDQDPTTERMLKGILSTEEEHAEELSSMLRTVSPAVGGISRTR